MFPALTLSRTFDMNNAWPIMIILMSYALGDTAGKQFGGNRGWINIKSNIYVFFCRFYFFWTMVALSKPTLTDTLLNSDAFAYVNQFLFAFTNGLSTSTL